MSDQPPVQQGLPPAQQGTDWEERYKGASRIINQRDERIKALEAELATKASENEQLRSQLGIKDVEKSTSIASYQTQLEQALKKASDSETALRSLQQFKAKYDAAASLGDQRLLPLIESIPYVENPESLKAIMSSFLAWGKGLVQEREAQLMSGVTPPPPASSVKVSGPTFATNAEWQKYVNSLTVGTPEKEAAMKAWWAWNTKKE